MSTHLEMSASASHRGAATSCLHRSELRMAAPSPKANTNVQVRGWSAAGGKDEHAP